MATTVLTASGPRTSGLRRFLTILLLIGILALLGAGGYLYSVARRALPQLDGSLKVVGLSAPVTVSRDHHGVPTIEAANFDELFLPKGSVLAQSRPWRWTRTARF